MEERIGKLIHKGLYSLRTRGLYHTCRRLAYWMIRKVNSHEKVSNFDNEGVLHLAFYPSGGLGDYIISRVILEKCLEYVNCDVTIFADKLEFAKSVYGDITSQYRLWYEYETDARFYDLALWVEPFVHVDYIKGARVRKFSKELAEKCEYIKYKNWHKLYVDIEEQWWRERIRFEECRVLGLDRWTELGMNGVFDINTHKVNIPLLPSDCIGEDLSICKEKYITLNYGSDVMVKGLKQLKLWIPEGYRTLIKLIKMEYPNIKIFQIGDQKAERIEGANEYLLGKSIEYIKYILKNSICHIDCEGGLVHLATQLGTKCVVLFGPTPVHMYGYKDNVNIVSPLCSNCMGLHKMWAYECYRGCEGSPCMEKISPELVFSEVKKVLDNADG